MDLQTLNELVEDIHEEFPDFELLYKKDSTFMKVLDFLLKLITLWRMKTFMTRFVTTIGEKVYLPEAWDQRSETSKIITLRHERVHMRQKAKYTSFGFSFLYLFFPFPVVFAYYRAKFEKEGYEESMRGIAEYNGVHILRKDRVKQNIVEHFTTAQYFWMWPFRSSIERWYDSVVEKLEAG